MKNHSITNDVSNVFFLLINMYNHMCLLIWTSFSGGRCGQWAFCISSDAIYMHTYISTKFDKNWTIHNMYSFLQVSDENDFYLFFFLNLEIWQWFNVPLKQFVIATPLRFFKRILLNVLFMDDILCWCANLQKSSIHFCEELCPFWI